MVAATKGSGDFSHGLARSHSLDNFDAAEPERLNHDASRTKDRSKVGTHLGKREASIFEPMVLRLGDGGYFLGCSRFPWCEHTTRLTEGEKQKLYMCIV